MTAWTVIRWRRAYIHQAASVAAVHGQEPQSLLAREAHATREPPARQPQVGDPRDPHGGPDRGLGGSQAGLAPQVGWHRVEAPLDRPPGVVERRHRGGGQRAGRGPTPLVWTGCRGTGPPPPPRGGVGRAVWPSPDEVRVGGHAWGPVARHARRHHARGVDLLAEADGHGLLGQAEEAPRSAIASIQGHAATLGSRPPAGPGAVAPLPRGAHPNARQVARGLPEGRPLEGAWGRAVAGPGASVQAPGEGRAVPGDARGVAAATVARGPRLAAGVQGGHAAGGERGGPSGVGRGARGTLGRAHAAGGERGGGGGQRRPHRPPAVAPSPWGEDQGPAWAPSAEPAARAPGARGVIP